MRILEITHEQLLEMLVKRAGCSSFTKETICGSFINDTHYRISMTYSKGEKPGPPFLCMVVEIREVRDLNDVVVGPIVAYFKDDDTFEAFAPKDIALEGSPK